MEDEDIPKKEDGKNDSYS